MASSGSGSMFKLSLGREADLTHLLSHGVAVSIVSDLIGHRPPWAAFEWVDTDDGKDYRADGNWVDQIEVGNRRQIMAALSAAQVHRSSVSARCSVPLINGAVRSVEVICSPLSQVNWLVICIDRALDERGASVQIPGGWMSKIAYEIRHDLRSPWGAVKAYSQLLSRYLTRFASRNQVVMTEDSTVVNELMPSLIRYAGEIETAANRGMALIDHLSTELSAVDGDLQLRVETFSPVILCRTVIEENEVISGRTVMLNVIGADGLMAGDQSKVAIVVRELVDNAVRYSNKDASITVDCEVETDRVTFVVADQGFGIPQDEADRIFEPFYCAAAHRQRNATRAGLGLFLCKAIVERHGGTITVQSVVGTGSRFTVSLPRGELAVEQTAK